MRNITIFAQNDVIKSKLGTMFVVSHMHDDMQKMMHLAFDVKAFKYYAQRIEVKRGMKFFADELVASPDDNALVFSSMTTIYDDFTGNFIYVGKLEDIKKELKITYSGFACQVNKQCSI